jgi:L-asparaginase II
VNTSTTPQPLAQVVRGETVESIHRGHLVVMDASKRILNVVGDPDFVTYFRSASKSFQAIPFITSGAADRFGMMEPEIAMACASHSGEPVHVALTAGMLDKAGLTEADLKCGTHLPFNEAEAERMLQAGERPNQLHNNCSGKHAAMVAYAKHIGAEVGTYDRIDNPIQQEILRTVAAFAEMPSEEIAIGIDGCAAPNFAMPLSAMARCFANLIDPPAGFSGELRAACKRIVSAQLNHPELIGGTERLDTLLMKAAPRRFISKVGADGVWLCGVPPIEQYPSGLVIALKIEDGDDRRARPVVAVSVLKRLGLLPADSLPDLDPMPLKNRRGDVVGRVESLAEI